MEIILKKSDFSVVPGGDLYEWNDAEMVFDVGENAKYLIKITASAKNAQQNKFKDDDDLRIRLDNYEFGKYEIHDEQISWKGFGTASSWDGASLKGGTKTNYFFVELQKGTHILKFFADGTPTIQEVMVYKFFSGEKFDIEELKPPQNIGTDAKGIPWMSFIFLGVKPKNINITATVHSAKQKKTTDGDNLKIVLNGKILKNQKVPASDKYKNFYFSGDLNQDKSEFLIISPEQFEFLEDSLDFWYDGEPSFYLNFDFFENIKEWMDMEISEKTKLQFFEGLLKNAVDALSIMNYKYSSNLLNYAFSNNPEKLIYKKQSGLVKKIKKDPAYQKILAILKKEIKNSSFSGQIILGDPDKDLDINFENPDLKFSLHGIKKIDYSALEKKKGKYSLFFILYDVYDFDGKTYYDWKNPISIPVHMADQLESSGILKNFEIEINISDLITLDT